MNKKTLITKIIINAIILIAIGIALSFVFDNAIIDNYIALGQMNNSDEAYLFMEYYNRAKTVAFTIYGFVVGFVIGKFIYNIYKFIKNKGEIKNEKN